MLYSHSRLSTFENCPLKFKYQYLDKIKTEKQGVEAFLGSRVHESLEKLYTDLKHQKLLTLKELLEYYNSEWKKNWNSQITIVKKNYKEENYRKMGEKFIEDYYNRFKPFNQERIMGIEQRIIITLDSEGKYNLQGYIDRLDYAGNGVYEIHDYKTNASLPLQEQKEKDKQLALYAIAVLKNYRDAKKVKLIWHFLAFDKEIVVNKTNEQLEELKKETIELIHRIEREKEFRPKVSNLCDWCDFKPICPEWKHKFKLDEEPANKYLKDTGVKLVNKLADLEEEKRTAVKKLEEEIVKVKEAIFALAKKEGISVVFGSNKKARISCSERVKFPGKNDAERPKLEAEIKDMGKWDEVSTLDTTALAKIAGSQGWSPELLKKIAKFQKTVTSERIYVSKLKDGE